VPDRFWSGRLRVPLGLHLLRTCCKRSVSVGGGASRQHRQPQIRPKRASVNRIFSGDLFSVDPSPSSFGGERVHGGPDDKVQVHLRRHCSQGCALRRQFLCRCDQGILRRVGHRGIPLRASAETWRQPRSASGLSVPPPYCSVYPSGSADLNSLRSVTLQIASLAAILFSSLHAFAASYRAEDGGVGFLHGLAFKRRAASRGLPWRWRAVCRNGRTPHQPDRLLQAARFFPFPGQRFSASLRSPAARPRPRGRFKELEPERFAPCTEAHPAFDHGHQAGHDGIGVFRPRVSASSPQ